MGRNGEVEVVRVVLEFDLTGQFVCVCVTSVDRAKHRSTAVLILFMRSIIVVTLAFKSGST